MPIRNTPLVNNHYYHVYNRGVEKRPIFINKRDYLRFFLTMDYYRFCNLQLKLSDYLHSFNNPNNNLIPRYNQNPLQVKIICYVMMPNHFHLILNQVKENGISTYIKNLSNSYTKFFNTKNKRIGPLFQGPFKAKLIESDEQLLHLSRYIHLNPYTSCVVKNINQLLEYKWSSLREYLFNKNICNTSIILNQFKNQLQCKKFVLDQAEYQKHLENLKHLTLE